MATLALDTYKLVSILKSKGFTEEQAIGVKEAIETINLDNLVTKQDLKTELAEFKSELFKWLVPLLLGQAALIAALVKLL